MDASVERTSFDLIEACWGRKWDTASHILGGDGYDVRFANDEAFTALHWTANHGAIVLTHALLLKGADPSVQNRFGSTPISLAALAGHVDVVRLLLYYGASPPLTKLDPGPLPAGTPDYPDAVLKIIQDAKGKALEERAMDRLATCQNTEAAAKLVLSGEVRRRLDYEEDRKREAAKAEAAAKEAKRVAEAKKHEERMSRVREKRIIDEKSARSAQRVAKIKATATLLGQWSIPLGILGLLCNMLVRALPEYATWTMVGSIVLGAIHSLRLWIEAPIITAPVSISKAKRR